MHDGSNSQEDKDFTAQRNDQHNGLVPAPEPNPEGKERDRSHCGGRRRLSQLAAHPCDAVPDAYSVGQKPPVKGAIRVSPRVRDVRNQQSGPDEKCS